MSGTIHERPPAPGLSELERIVGTELAPHATAVDRTGRFPSEQIAALAGLGLFGMAVPKAAGGLGLAGAETRAVLRLISSGCGATAFSFAQHHGTVGSVATTKNDELRAAWLPRLLDDTLAGTAFAHVRRPASSVLSATPSGDGWVIDGRAPWVTSWGHAAAMSVAATTDDGRIVWSLLPMAEHGGVRVDTHFDLAAFGATATVALAFDSVEVSADSVLRVDDRATWTRRDRLMAARPSPLCLGIGDRILATMDDVDADLADGHRARFDDLAVSAERAAAAVDEAVRSGLEQLDDDALDQLVQATADCRTAVIVEVQRLATVLLAAVGGSAMDRAHPAQRLSREAMFYVVQAQSPDGRAATLERLSS